MSTPLFAFLLMTCRLVAGGALVIAGLIKVANPRALMLSIQGYDLLPEMFIPFIAYALPWSELAIGLLLVYGAWSREAATLALGLYGVFTIAVVSVLVRGISMDCGCFGGMFGEAAMDWTTVVRNLVFIGFSAAIVWKGAGPLAIDAMIAREPSEKSGTPVRSTLKTPRESTT